MVRLAETRWSKDGYLTEASTEPDCQNISKKVFAYDGLIETQRRWLTTDDETGKRFLDIKRRRQRWRTWNDKSKIWSGFICSHEVLEAAAVTFQNDAYFLRVWPEMPLHSLQFAGVLVAAVVAHPVGSTVVKRTLKLHGSHEYIRRDAVHNDLLLAAVFVRLDRVDFVAESVVFIFVTDQNELVS